MVAGCPTDCTLSHPFNIYNTAYKITYRCSKLCTQGTIHARYTSELQECHCTLDTVRDESRFTTTNAPFRPHIHPSFSELRYSSHGARNFQNTVRYEPGQVSKFSGQTACWPATVSELDFQWRKRFLPLPRRSVQTWHLPRLSIRLLGAPSLGIKRLEREAKHTTPSSTQIQNWYLYITYSPSYVFVEWY